MAEDRDGKRVYDLTADGRSAAEARTGTLPWEQAAADADDDLVALRDLAFGLMAATRQVAQAGSKEQLDAAKEILGDPGAASTGSSPARLPPW